MDYHFFKEKLNRFYQHYLGNDRPVFFNIEDTLPELNEVTQNYPLIKREFEQLMRHCQDLPRYHDIDPGESEISDSTPKDWNVFMLYLLGYQLDMTQTHCPELLQILKKIPGLMQAFFSILKPGKSIPKHQGPYLGYLRYHLGIEVPEHQPPKIIVNDKPYQWKNGEAVMFDDFWPHEVVNHSTEPRVVLIIDVLRPMPFLPQMVNRFITHVIARQFYGKKVMQRCEKFGVEARPLAQ